MKKKSGAKREEAENQKIAVIEDADRMNLNAANALLKSLEEPPPESFIALATGTPGRLLPTVRSRCQQVQVHPGDEREVRAWLAQAGVDLKLAGYLAVEYGGAPFDIVAAAERAQKPLWTALEKAGRSAAAARPVADELREQDLGDLLQRWLRILHWLLRQWAEPERPAALGFAAHLLEARRVALLNTGLNRSMQLQRLLLLWSELWCQMPIARVPSIVF